MSLFIVGGVLRLVTRICLGFVLVLRSVARLRLLAGRLVRDVSRRFRLRPHPSSYCAKSGKNPEHVL